MEQQSFQENSDHKEAQELEESVYFLVNYRLYFSNVKMLTEESRLLFTC